MGGMPAPCPLEKISGEELASVMGALGMKHALWSVFVNERRRDGKCELCPFWDEWERTCILKE